MGKLCVWSGAWRHFNGKRVLPKYGEFWLEFLFWSELDFVMILFQVLYISRMPTFLRVLLDNFKAVLANLKEFWNPGSNRTGKRCCILRRYMPFLLRSCVFSTYTLKQTAQSLYPRVLLRSGFSYSMFYETNLVLNSEGLPWVLGNKGT